jgi:solute carrier family 25 carnitine/acylcarnitine transporter 20/29
MTSYAGLIKELYSERGIRSLYKGYWATFWRDVPIFGAFFFIYEYLNKMFIKEGEASKHFKLILISGLAGICNWVPTYPADLVKSIIQCHPGKDTLTMK